MRKFLSLISRAIHDYSMIKDGDKVLVGISGGKDSTLLALALGYIQKYYKTKFELRALMIDHGFEEVTEAQVNALVEFLASHGIKMDIVKTNIKQIVFDQRKEKNPCWLCARFRRAALCEYARENGFNKIALGHHKDDVIETLLLSIFYEGRLSTFGPITHLDRTDTTIIRPMIYVSENTLIANAKNQNYPIIENPCPYDKNTQRTYVKRLIKQIEKDVPPVRDRMLSALTNPQRNNLWDQYEKQQPFKKTKTVSTKVVTVKKVQKTKASPKINADPTKAPEYSTPVLADVPKKTTTKVTAKATAKTATKATTKATTKTTTKATTTKATKTKAEPR
ncbi:MAG: tRNA lysidine(34) synthetase TilS [Firmicutes bacterium]|nr:tRNA lysidine(34) synthetase TilS [Bacillota bacterium]